MIGSRFGNEGSDGWYRARRLPLSLPGAAELEIEVEDPDVDWETARVVGLIERQGSVSTEILDADWE